MPAASAALRVLRYLSERTTPVPAARIAHDLGLPRSSMYHLLTAMAAESFVVHYPEDQLWGSRCRRLGGGPGLHPAGTADPAGPGADRPSGRLARPLRTPRGAAGRRSPSTWWRSVTGADRLVTDVGVRLPAHLTASGRAILAGLPPAHVRRSTRPVLRWCGAPKAAHGRLPSSDARSHPSPGLRRGGFRRDRGLRVCRGRAAVGVQSGGGLIWN